MPISYSNAKFRFSLERLQEREILPQIYCIFVSYCPSIPTFEFRANQVDHLLPQELERRQHGLACARLQIWRSNLDFDMFVAANEEYNVRKAMAEYTSTIITTYVPAQSEPSKLHALL